MPTPPRVVSLAPSNTEIVCALGASDALVGLTELCDWPPGIQRNRTTVGGWTDTDFESVVALRPDLVITSTFLQRAIADYLRRRQLTVLHLDVCSLTHVSNSFQRVAEAIDQPAAGHRLVDRFQRALAEVSIKSLPITRVYVEEWMQPPSVSGNWVPELLALAGGRGLATTSKPSYPVTLAEVQAFNPELMVVSWCNTKGRPNLRALLARPGWSSLRALQRKQVNVIDDSLLNRPGPRLVEGLRILHRLINAYRQLERPAKPVLESSP